MQEKTTSACRYHYITLPTSGSCLLLIGVLRRTVLYRETPRIYERVYAYIYIALVTVD